jgi:hypothetical protein
MVTNGIIESKKTKEIDKNNVKQSSFTNSLKDTENNLYTRRFVRMLWKSKFDGGYRFYPPHGDLSGVIPSFKIH